MQSKSLGKIKSAPKTHTLKLWWVGLFALFICAVALWLAWAGMNDSQKPHAVLGSRTVQLELARTPEEQSRGLSNRAYLAENSGMLFVYDETGYRCFWMKDMQFPIDIIWISSAQTITRIDTNVKPQTYPKKYCAHSQFVLEVPAGTANANSIASGQKARLLNIR